jgi:hypothetical protein
MVWSCSSSWWLSTGIFFLGYDVTLGSCEGYSVGCLSVPDVFFLTKKLYKAPVPDGC